MNVRIWLSYKFMKTNKLFYNFKLERYTSCNLINVYYHDLSHRNLVNFLP